MQNSTVKQDKKPARVPIGFRVSEPIKSKLITAARAQNIEPSDVYRHVFNEGLKKVYGLKIVGNEMVE